MVLMLSPRTMVVEGLLVSPHIIIAPKFFGGETVTDRYRGIKQRIYACIAQRDGVV